LLFESENRIHHLTATNLNSTKRHWNNAELYCQFPILIQTYTITLYIMLFQNIHMDTLVL
jgi:hypothetical protein